MMILSALRASFDEANCRLLIGIMCDVMKGRSEDETAAVSIDMMTWRLEELRLDDEDDLAAPTAAIAGAVTQLIDEQSFRPSIHEVRDRVIEHSHQPRADAPRRWRALLDPGRIEDRALHRVRWSKENQQNGFLRSCDAASTAAERAKEGRGGRKQGRGCDREAIDRATVERELNRERSVIIL